MFDIFYDKSNRDEISASAKPECCVGECQPFTDGFLGFFEFQSV